MRVVLLTLVVVTFALILRPGADHAAHARFLLRTGLTFMSVSTVLTGIFAVAEATTGPGGWRAAGLAALWLVPMAVIGTVAWRRPGWAGVPLAVLTAGATAEAVIAAAYPRWLLMAGQGVGPVQALVILALGLPLALYGWHRPAPGGAMLLALGVVPVTAAALGSGFAALSLAAVATPPALAGLLYVAAEMSRHSADREARSPSRVGVAGRGSG